MAAFWSAAGGSAAVSCLKSGDTVKSVAEVPNLRPLRRQRHGVVASMNCPHLNSSCNNNIKLKIKVMAEHKGGAEQVLARPRKAAVAEAHGSDDNGGTTSRTFLSEEELFLSMKKRIEAKRLPASAAAAMEDVYRNYQNAVFESGNPNAKEIVLSNMATAFDRMLLQFEDPFTFSNYHRAIREPFDYYMFGQNYIRPLIDFRLQVLQLRGVGYSIKRICLGAKNAEDLVYIHSNLCLLSHKQLEYIEGVTKNWDLAHEYADFDAIVEHLAQVFIDEHGTALAHDIGVGSASDNLMDCGSNGVELDVNLEAFDEDEYDIGH